MKLLRKIYFILICFLHLANLRATELSIIDFEIILKKDIDLDISDLNKGWENEALTQIFGMEGEHIGKYVFPNIVLSKENFSTYVSFTYSNNNKKIIASNGGSFYEDYKESQEQFFEKMSKEAIEMNDKENPLYKVAPLIYSKNQDFKLIKAWQKKSSVEDKQIMRWSDMVSIERGELDNKLSIDLKEGYMPGLKAIDLAFYSTLLLAKQEKRKWFITGCTGIGSRKYVENLPGELWEEIGEISYIDQLGDFYRNFGDRVVNTSKLEIHEKWYEVAIIIDETIKYFEANKISQIFIEKIKRNLNIND